MPDKRVRGREKFRKYKKPIMLLAAFFRLFPIGLREKMFENVRDVKGNIGYLLRYALLRATCRKCGDNVSVGPGAYILNVRNLYLGNNISIHPMCYIDCGMFEDSYVRIDDDVSIAHAVTIISTSHTYRHKTITVIKDMPMKYRPVHICSNVWIGAKATILYGVTVESGCVIGANSVVTGSTLADGVYVGAPARRIKERLHSETMKE